MPKPKTEAAEYKRLTLRVPQEVLDTLQQQAKTIGRTVNTHALFVLRYGLGIDSTLPMPGGRPHVHRSRK